MATYHFNVEVELRKGLGPETVTKNIEQFYDDVPEDVPEEEVRQWAINDTNDFMYKSEDYPLYGKNWQVIEVYTS